MKVRAIEAWETLSASYWFIPSLMAIGAIALSEAAIQGDALLGIDWLRQIDWLYTAQPDGARAMLSTVAGSMITVAGVTFSMTILALSHASSQIGPRLLTNFMRDRGNQITLGTFIATFIYCLLVLRTVRSADSAPAPNSLDEFVPQIAVILALLLALLSVGVLIYFVHHIPEILSMSNLIERVSGTLHERIDSLYPTELGEVQPSSHEAVEAVPPELGRESEILTAQGVIGYVKYVDEEGLIDRAAEVDVVIELTRRPGDFVGPDTELARIHGVAKLDEETRAFLRSVFVCGAERTPHQDVCFPALELVEVAVRALSPGVNDPYTAIRCIDQLGAALIAFSHRELPDALRHDCDGKLRVIAPPVSLQEFADTIVDGLRPYASADALCAAHLLFTLRGVADALPPGPNRSCIEEHAAAVLTAVEQALDDPRDLALARKAAAGTTAA